MKAFHCDHCGNLAFFENTQCTNCHRLLAYLPDLTAMASLDQSADGGWSSPWSRAAGRVYHLCQNYNAQGICNWAIPVDDRNPLCQSCRLTQVIPNLRRALISGLEQMHMHAPAGLPRCFADRGDERIGTPLRTTGPELNGKESALGLGSDRLDVGDLLYHPRHRGKELGLKGLGGTMD